MLKSKYLLVVLTLCLVAIGATSCSDDDGDRHCPTFSAITVTPEKDVYQVGDVITCSITKQSEASDDLRDASYWWYASWWFTDPEMTADFQEFQSDGTCTSTQITLTEPGEVTLYFFGKIEFPNFDWRKIEIGKTITVEGTPDPTTPAN